MINQIVDRCHVADSDRDVIKYLRSRLTREARFSRDPKIRQARREAYADAIKRHRENQGLYHTVMSGRF
jgi:hypothetical protein